MKFSSIPFIAADAAAGAVPESDFFQELPVKVADALHINPKFAENILLFTGAIGLFVLALTSYWLVRLLLARVDAMAARKFTGRADVLAGTRILRRIALFAPALVFTHLGAILFQRRQVLCEILATAVNIYVIGVTVAIVLACLTTLEYVANRKGLRDGLPVRGVVQAFKIFTLFLGGILILSLLLNKSPVYFLSGLGALSAVLLLVFKDALLGFVAGIMLSANRMVVVGDWIEIARHDVDGEVIDVSLTTVKVRNWDMTIVTVPSYSLIDESFKNWRGMSESGGRRVKRSINLDMQTIRFADPEMLARWGKMDLLKKYLAYKLEEIRAAEAGEGVAEDLVDGRRLTNIGTFRAYCMAYLRAHPKVHQKMTLLVRQLDSGEHGLPLELYFFSNTTDWATYENIQSDIFDHLLAIIGEFDLAVYQTPSSTDQREFTRAIGGIRK
ncbi:MAG: mechanosensitive ion channel family protein [Puniceicoccales bacterium]|jgi:miniconductance mechanosensitive channel|nr:mechanosensitive ion channel family protein [Puniceicoccales bacterium]